MESVFQTFYNYMGTGLIVIWFLLAVIYLFLCEKRKPRRILFVYMPIMVLLCFFNPLFAKLFYSLVGEEIYFRICWLLPIIVVIAYSIVTISERLKGKTSVCFLAVSLALAAFSGKLVYSSSLYSRAENIYHVPDSVVHICDSIVVPGREVRAAFPTEMLLYVRQYSPVVCMPYGREVMMGDISDLYLAMESDPVELALLLPQTRERECHYIVLRQTQELVGEPSAYGLDLFLETDGYVVYRDPAVPLVIPEGYEVKNGS